MQPQIPVLLDKCLNQTATEAERQELLTLLSTPGLEEEAAALLKEAFLRNKEIESLPEASAADILSTVLQSSAQTLTPQEDAESVTSFRRIPLRRWGWAAAAAVVLFTAGSYFWYQRSHQQSLADQQRLPADVQPGKEGAVLTLADGTKVVLDSLSNGLIAEQSNSTVTLQNGQLAYRATSQSPDEIVYNTMTTPRGRQFNITLSDGTKVWLNAASSIKYPAVFSADKRQVEVTGEAYFEVAKDKKRPFYININNKAIATVLGTSFNINAYAEEASINTTLLEGSLKVKASNEVLLTPGQQANIGEAKIAVTKADMEKVMAWRNGLFHFEGLTLQEAMLQLSRWYDIEVKYDKAIYEKELQNTRLAGEVRRDLTLANVLDLLKELGLHFSLEGKQLTVLP